MKALALLLLGVVAAVSAVEWVEPSFVETAATSKLRGVSHTVAPHKGMVTYISPARHVQTSGIVLTPPPSVSVVEASLPRPQVLIQPVVFERGLASAYDVPYHNYVDDVSGFDVPTQVEHDLEYAHNAMFGAHTHHRDHLHAHAHAHAHATHMHHGVDVPAIDGDDHGHGHVHGHHHHLPLAAHVDVHDVHPRHHHHASFHPVFPVHADLHIPAAAPVGVPESLYRTPYHQPHVDHASPISFGSIVVPHDSHGAIALEEPEYTGYNPGPPIVPHAHVRVVHRTDPALPEHITYTVPRVVREYPLK